ncbi:MAG TPA: DUF72 domain-containing protein [Candidatus Limnocylindrales bacterium]|jgi:uncharacterized protein YecE (DUF72 family)|nr:DUF72 domain-containing protein [Candidatus Limnocylindrales bacterium]
MRIRAGTSGWSYKEWKGHFYPEKLAAKDMLRFYGERFPTVEVNNTFYRMPNAATLEGWAAQVPEDFSFVLKASKRITHDKRLKEAGDSVEYLLRTAAALGPKLGPLLIQLPPNMKKDVPRLRDFLVSLPARAAFEFRHASWYDDEVYEALRERGAAWCVADTGEEGDPPFVSTADWGYLRLRRVAYEERDLKDYVERIMGQSWNEAFVFFKHEDAGTGPKLAARFMELWG